MSGAEHREADEPDKDGQKQPHLSEALEHSEKLGQFFDPGAQFWQKFYASDPTAGERLTAFREALRSVNAKGLWLDAGCGIGVIVRQSREMGLRVCGIDVSGQLLEEARNVTGLPLVAAGDPRAPAEHLCRASIEKLPYDTEHFDGVYCSSVLEYVADLELALAELHRVVRKGGDLAFTVPNAFSVARIGQALTGRSDDYFRLVPRWAYWKWEIVGMLKRAGWEARDFAYFGSTRRLRGRVTRQPWAAYFTMVVAHRPD